MRKIVMLSSAVDDLDSIVNYLSNMYPTTAAKQYHRIIESIRVLSEYPEMCEIYDQSICRSQYRKLVIDDYLVFYLVLTDTIEIHRILHGKQNISQYL